MTVSLTETFPLFEVSNYNAMAHGLFYKKKLLMSFYQYLKKSEEYYYFQYPEKKQLFPIW